MKLRDKIALSLAKEMLHLAPEDLVKIYSDTEEGVLEDELDNADGAIRGAYFIANIFMRVREE